MIILPGEACLAFFAHLCNFNRQKPSLLHGSFSFVPHAIGHKGLSRSQVGSFSFVTVHKIGWSFGIILKPFKSLVRAFQSQKGIKG